MVYQVTEKPTAAFILSLIGGILGMIGGVVFLMLAWFLSAASGGLLNFIAIIYIGVGAWFIVSSSITITAACKLNSNPFEHHKWGLLVLIFSIVGGGTILGIVGGVLALVWKPSVVTPPVPGTWKCPNPRCGKMNRSTARYCGGCGWRLDETQMYDYGQR